MSIFTIKKNVDIHDQKEKSRICQVVGPLGLAPPSQSGFGQPEPERERAGAKNDPAASARNPEPPALRSQSVKSAWRKIGPMNTRAENNLAFRAPSDPLPSPDPLPPPETFVARAGQRAAQPRSRQPRCAGARARAARPKSNLIVDIRPDSTRENLPFRLLRAQAGISLRSEMNRDASRKTHAVLGGAVDSRFDPVELAANPNWSKRLVIQASADGVRERSV